MGLRGKLVSKTNIKSDGDVFHELWRNRPHQVSEMSPDKVQNCELHDGQWGKVGSVIFWNFTLDGKNMVAKEIIESIDEENKSITLNMIEGDLMKLYKTLKISNHVDTNGNNNIVTWTFVYEKLSENVSDPHKVMELAINVTKDIEAHHLCNPN